jgi:hypothetical protein
MSTAHNAAFRQAMLGLMVFGVDGAAQRCEVLTWPVG